MFNVGFRYIFVALIACCLLTRECEAQTEKIVNDNAQFWISTNNMYVISDRWGLLTDVHIRRTNFIKDPSFYFLRGGAQYWIKENLRVAGGYAHLWSTNEEDKWYRYTNENRIYQQVSLTHRYPGSSLFLRVRNEQRFFNTVENGESLDNNYMVNRVRLLMSFSVPFKKGGRASLMIADEVHMNFGKSIVYNTFNQNRLTVGISSRLSKNWRFDTGYMMVYQQTAAGNVYNLNHTFRLFFYGNFDFRKDKSRKLETLRQADE